MVRAETTSQRFLLLDALAVISSFDVFLCWMFIFIETFLIALTVQLALLITFFLCLWFPLVNCLLCQWNDYLLCQCSCYFCIFCIIDENNFTLSYICILRSFRRLLIKIAWKTSWSIKVYLSCGVGWLISARILENFKRRCVSVYLHYSKAILRESKHSSFFFTN